MKLAFDAPGTSIPERLGKHRIVGKLATGGMASVYLARLVGPAGFENVVVIKRMLPHLAEDARFREMFADEARTVAKIRHPNVVRTFELVEGTEDLYLVMEYLEGETLQRLSHTLASLGKHLSLGLACFIIAESAAGLHAAHELEDENGTPLGIVHRDVSPHNLFLTFDGGVKVIDFGIAKSVDRTGSTTTGELKGKFAYMAPEQIAARPVDRTTDIFALGITLWELLTRKRLFQRDNQMATLRAVTDEACPPPSTLNPEVAPSLDAICARCLAKDPHERYATMADLRRDLMIELRRLDEADPPGELGRLMQSLFEKSIALRKAMLRDSRAGEEPRLDASPIDVTIDEGPTQAGASSQIRRTDPTLPVVTSRGPERKGMMPMLLGGAGLAIVLVGAGTALSLGSGTSPPEARPTVAAAPTPVVEAVAEREEIETTPAITRVHVAIVSEPVGALVIVDGIARGNAPLELDLPLGDAPLPLELSLEGRRTTTTRFVPDRDQSLRVSLPRAARGGSGRPAGGEPTPEEGGFFAFE